MNDWTDVGSYAYNKMLREREADEALLRQALEALEGARIDYDYHGNATDISDQDILKAIAALKERLHAR